MDKINPNTYCMMFQCCNCNYIFKANIEKGIKALGHGGKCPFCGVLDYLDDDNMESTHKPIRYTF